MALSRPRPMRFLRSRRLAAALILAICMYSIVTTAIPQESVVATQDVATWQSAHPVSAALARALGLHRAYSSPLFLIPAVLLTLSTALCAWERSRASSTFLALRREVPERLLARLERAPSVAVVLPAATTEQGLLLTGDAVARIGLRGQVTDGVFRAHRATWASLGSAVFHWALVGLFVAAGAGQLMKWEGQIGIPVGHRVTDSTSSYGRLVKGQLAPGAPETGYTIEVSEMDLDHAVGAAETGHAPDVALYEGESLVAQSLVYPNSPLHHRALYVHRGPWGLAVVASLETSAGEEVGRRNFLIEIGSTEGTGRLHVDDGMPPETGIDRIRFAIPLDSASDGEGFVGDVPLDPRVEVSVPGSEDLTMTVMRPGDVRAFPGGELRLRIVDVTRYARLVVVHDASIPFVYFFFVLAMLGGALALMVHPRAVLAVAEEAEGGVAVKALVLSKRIDPLFKHRVHEALSSLAETEGDS